MSEGQTAAPSQWALQQRAGSPAPSGGGGNNAIDNPFAAISNAAMQTYGSMGQNNSMSLQINLFQQVFGSQNG